MVFGYARVSTAEQNLDLQFDTFLKEGIDKKNIYTDKVSSLDTSVRFVPPISVS
ncbi:MAG: recombinase family protein [Arenibacter algicola]|tara:strand:- start:2 stop:163 length:162 start_codon:yes stop_codon:yes gene_type:complete